VLAACKYSQCARARPSRVFTQYTGLEMEQNKKAPYAYKIALWQIRERYCFDGWIGDQEAQVFFERGWNPSYFENVVMRLGVNCSLSALLQFAAAR